MRTPITTFLLVGIAACLLVLAFAVTDRGPRRDDGSFFRDTETGLVLRAAPPEGWEFAGPSDEDTSRRFRLAYGDGEAESADAEMVEVTVLASAADSAGLTRSELFARERGVVQQFLAETKSIVTDRHVRLGALGDSDRLAARGAGRDGRDWEIRSYVIERNGLLVVYRVRGDSNAIASRRGDLDAILSSLRIESR